MVAFFILPGHRCKLKLANPVMQSGHVQLVVGPMHMPCLMPPPEWSCLQNQNAHSTKVCVDFVIQPIPLDITFY